MRATAAKQSATGTEAQRADPAAPPLRVSAEPGRCRACGRADTPAPRTNAGGPWPQPLAVVRIDRGLSRIELASALGLDPAKVRRYEDGEGRLSASTCARWAAALQIEPRAVQARCHHLLGETVMRNASSLRMARGETQATLGARIDMNAKAIARIERSDADPNDPHWQRWAAALGLERTDLERLRARSALRTHTRRRRAPRTDVAVRTPPRRQIVREDRALSPTALGALLGISAWEVGRYERNEREPSPAVRRRWARTLGVSVRALEDGTAAGLPDAVLRQRASLRRAAGRSRRQTARAMGRTERDIVRIETDDDVSDDDLGAWAEAAGVDIESARATTR